MDNNIIHHKLSLLPITASAITKDYYLIGEGTHVQIYDRISLKHVTRQRILDDQAIHGLTDSLSRSSSYEFFAWGGRQIRKFIIWKSNSTASVELSPLIGIPDWLLQVVASSDVKALGFHAILITAHNVLFGLRGLIGVESQTITILKELGHSVRNLLYAADLQILPGSSVGIAAGTATGKIFVWSYNFDNIEKDKVQIHYIFSSHQGSIFGLRFAKNACLPETEAALQPYLVSCSDDRTIKIWNVRNLFEPSIRNESFPSVTEAFKVTEAAEEKLLVTATGHASRIWDVKIFGAEPSSLSVLSVGEDATVQLWEFSHGLENGLEDGKRCNLQHRQKFAFNSKRNIWSSAVFSASSTAAEILVGGADGKIVKYPIRAAASRNSVGSQILANKSLNDFQEARYSKDFLRDYDFLDANTLVGITNNGIVLGVNIFKEAHIESLTFKCFKIGQRDSLRWYSKIKCIRDIGHACVVGASGSIYIYNHFLRRLSTLTQVEGKVGAIFVSHWDAHHFTLLVTRIKSDIVHFLVIRWTSAEDAELQDNIPIQLPHSFTVTSVAFAHSEKDMSRLFLGGRDGSILLISLGNSDLGSVKLLNLVQLDNIHQGESVTALLLENNSDSIIDRQDLRHETSFHWLFSTGRDGNLAVLKFDETYNTDTATLSHRNGFDFGPHIEGMYRDTNSSSLYIYGFRGTDFVVYKEQLDQEIIAVECGGAHRKWTFFPFTATNPGRFAWTKSSSLHLHLVSTQSHEILRSGGHGREIKAMAVSPNVRENCSNWPLVATGAEDTDIRLFAYGEEEQPELRCLKVVKKHVTGIQGLQWCPKGQYLFSSGGFQEFFAWKIHSLPLVSVGIVCESACPSHNFDTELRITGFSVKSWPYEADVMDFDNNLVYLITMAYSDSTILIYRYEPVGFKWTQLQKTSNHNSCLTQLSIFPWANRNILLGSDADGYLSFWPFGGQTQPVTGKVMFSSGDDADLSYVVSAGRIHENGVACIIHRSLNPSTALVASGGDDGTLALTLIDARGNPSSETRKYSLPVATSTVRLPGAHAASLSALMFVSREQIIVPSSNDQLSIYALSSGNDQRLKLWKIDVDSTRRGAEEINVACIIDVFTPVADVSSLAIVKERSNSNTSIVIAGTGLDIWNIEEFSKILNS